MRSIVTLLLVCGAILGAPAAAAAAGTPADAGLVRVTLPAAGSAAETLALEFSLPAQAAAVDGRILFDTTAAEVVGVAPAGGGSALAPQQIDGGVAFGAYGLRARGGRTTLRVVIAPLAAGQLELRLVIDAAADASGRRLGLRRSSAVGTTRIDGALRRIGAPAEPTHFAPRRAAGTVRDLVADGALGKMDLDVVRAGWELAHLAASPCAGIDPAADANGDGCVDIVDIQAVLAGQGERSGRPLILTGDTRSHINSDAVSRPASDGPGGTTAARNGAVLSIAAAGTFIVTSTADTPDASNGDGLCADTQGRCTLRAAITESNWQTGDNRIEFNLTGTAPVMIQLSSSPLSLVQDRTGGLVIDGYSQPGSSVNTAAVGSNAVMGVELRGTTNNPQGWNLFITSANNVVRGILFANGHKTVFIDHGDAHDNLIVGNWFGYVPSGAASAYRPYNGVYINAGAHHNRIGTPALEDRNVVRGTKGIYLHGPGTDYNVLQNNLVCLTTSGMGGASCNTAIDHDFGPDNNLVGGAGPGERNIVGPTTLNGIEISHGWDPNGSDTRYQNNNNSIIGNWVGFRGDGQYDASFRSGQQNPGGGDNGNGINVYDGSNFNLVQGNHVASVYDGIQTMSPNSAGNIIRFNIVGESPLGQPAPLTRYGIVVRQNTRSHVVEDNIVRNAGTYGIALSSKDILWVRVSRNIVTDTSAPALFFAPDPDDPTKGADNLQPAPAITSATTLAVAGTALAGGTVEVYRASRAVGEIGLPVEYLGSAIAAPDASWSMPINVQSGDRVTALQIASNGNTSNLAPNVVITFEEPPAPPVADFTWSQHVGTLEVAFADTSTGTPTSWSWDFDDGTGSTDQNASHTFADPGEYTVRLVATNAGGSSTVTKMVEVEPPAGPNVVAADGFGRTATGGWGHADIGGQYTTSGTAANYSVANGAGSMIMPSAGSSRSALLGEVTQLNVDLRFRVAVDKPAAGAAYFIYAVVRRNTNNEYRPRIILNGNGTVSVGASRLLNGSEATLGPAVVVPGLTQAAGQFIWLRAEVTGTDPTTIRVKAWADGSAEPAGWQFTASNNSAALQGAGSIGIRAHIAPGVTTAPVQLTFDEMMVSTIAASTSFAADGFGRTATGGWGHADIGGQYTTSGTAANYSVANGAGSMIMPSAGSSRSALLGEVTQLNVDLRFRVAVDKPAAGAAYFIYAVVRRNTNNEYRPRIILNGNGTVSVGASRLLNGSEATLGPAVVVPGLTQAAGQFIWLRAEVTGTDPTTIRVKAWADGSAEPAGWQFTASNNSAALQGAGSIGIRAHIAPGVTTAPVQLTFDDLSATTSQ